VNIPRLGPLAPNPRIPEWLISAPVAISFFDGQKLTFTFDSLDATDEPDATSAIDAFLALTSQDRKAASQFVFANYRRIAELVSAEDLGCAIPTEQDVWSHVTPSEIYISRRHRRDKAIYIQIIAECAWEPEHGLQLVYRRGKELARVSEQDGHLTHTDAYGLPESEDRIVEDPKSAPPNIDRPTKRWWKFW